MNVRNVARRLFSVGLVCVVCLGLTSTALGVVNVSNFGAQGDLLTLQDAIVASNSTSITSPSASFTSADVGKLVEVFNAGPWEGLSNATLFARISGVSSLSNITVSVPAEASGTNFILLYGTDDYPPFTNAIAHCALPTDTIIIPSGNYFILPPNSLSTNGHSASINYTLRLNRGGITFEGVGTATLTGMGGWVNYNNQGQRSALFAMPVPMTNNFPLIFSNLVLDGGCVVGNVHNLSWPVSGSTGYGWDGTHHWMVTVGGTGRLIDSLVMINCTIQHWRGEMMEETSGSQNLYLYATNCAFLDGDASCINNFGHNCVACTFSNANQAEEFYRTYNTNTSYLTGCTLESLSSGIALNGGTYTGPFYNICGNTFTNLQFAVMTTPACNVLFASNNVYSSQGIALGVAGYQGTTVNSNIIAAWNTFNGPQYPLAILGGGENLSEYVYFFSNTVVNSWGIGTGYGWSTNVWCFNNTGSNVGAFYMPSLTGQYFFDWTNNYKPAGNYAASSNAPVLINYANGASEGVLDVYYSSPQIRLVDSCKIPSGQYMRVTNTSHATLQVVDAGNTNVILGTLKGGQGSLYYWSGSAWGTNADLTASPTNMSNPIIQITPEDLSMGTNLVDTSTTNSLTVENVGNGTLIGSVTVAAPFYVVSGGTYNLDSNQSQTVLVAFNATSAGDYSQEMAFTGGGGATAIITGTALNAPTPVIAIGASSLSLGTILTNTAATNTFTVQNSGTGTLTGTATVPAPFSILSGGSYSLTTGQSQMVSVLFSPTVAGSYVQTLALTGAGGTNLAVSGVATNAPIPVIAIGASSLSLGAILTNTAATNTFTVQNSGTGTLTGTATVAAPFSILSGGSYSLTAGQSQTVTVSFSPTVAGSYAQTLALTGAGGTNLAVAGVATNAPIPVISVGANSLSLGTILTNMAATNTFMVQNSGTGTLTGTATVAAPFSILSGGSYNLTAGQSQTVSVLFSPTTAGSYVQTLALTGAGGTNLAVSGVATNAPIPVIAIGASSLSLGAILTNTAATNTFTVQNSGTGTLTGTATVSAPFSILSGGSYNLTAGQSQTVSVLFSPTTAGSFAQILALTGAGGTNLAVAGLATNAPIPVIAVGASSLSLGTILTNTAATNTFTVQNSGTGTLTGTATVPAPFSILSGGSYSLTTGQSQMVSVLFSPTVAGSYVQALALTGAGGTNLAVSGVATNAPIPVIAIGASSLSLGAILTNTAATNTFTVQNSGTGTLTGTATVAAPFSILSGGSYSLTAGQSQTVTVSFSPTVAGSYAQTLALTGAGGTNLAVAGVATNAPIPVISVGANSLSLGTILTNMAATNTFMVQNSGTGTLTGTATVAAPFSILSGGSYNLTAGQSQTVSVLFSPTTAGSYVQTLALTGAGGTNLAVSGVATNAPIPVIAIGASSLSLGAILTNTAATNTFTVQNSGTGTLTGTATVPAPFSILSGGSYSLTTGQSQMVSVLFSPTVAGSYVQTLALTGAGGTNLAVSGVATNAPIPVIAVGASSLTLGTILTNTAATNTFTVQNSGTGTLTGTATVSAPFSILSGGSYSLTTGQSQTVSVLFSPTTAGSYVQTLALTGAGGTNLAVSGVATNAPMPVIAIGASSLSLGTILTNTAATNTFTVQNSGTGTLTGTATVPAPFSILSGGSYNLTAGQSQTVSVLFSPTAAGSYAQTLALTGAGGTNLAVAGVATNAPIPVIAVGASSLTLGTILTNTAATNTFTVQNSGTGTLTGTATVSAPFSILSGGSYNLTAGQSQTVSVLFSPTTAGSYAQILALTGAGGTNLTVAGVATNAPIPVISVGASSLSLGTILTNTAATNTFMVQNSGTGTLTGTATVSAPFSILSGGSYNLTAGQSQTVSVLFSPTTAGSYVQTLALTGAGGTNLTVAGVATNAPIPVIAIGASSLSLGTILTNTAATNTFTVQNSGTGTLTGTATVSAPFSILSGGSYSLTTGQSQTVSVLFSPTTAGSYVQTLALTGAGGTNLAVSGVATNAPMPVIAIGASSLSLGTILTNTAATNTFTVQNSGTGTLTGTATVPAPFSILSGGSYNLTAGQSQTVSVLFSPTAAGSYAQTLALTGAGGTNLAVAGVATNAPIPVIAVGASSLTLGTILTNTAATNTFTVQNSGTGTLTGTATVSAPFSILSGGSYNLTAGQSQTVSVLFSPTTAGSYAQILALTGAGGTNLTVAGVATNAPIPVISVGASSLSLGTILTNTAATNTFMVQNSGTGTLTGTATVSAPFSILSGGSYNLTAGQSQTVSVLFSPTTAGSYVQTLALTGAGGTNLTVAGVATNAPIPVIAIGASSLSLGTILTNTAATNTFMVQNSGTGTLTGTATVPSPFSILSGGSYNLTAGQSQTVSVLFSPTVAGSYVQTLALTGAGGTNLTVAGVATNAPIPVISVGASSLSLGTILTNTAATNTFMVQNSGTGTLTGTATVPSPFSILSGGSYNLTAGQSQTVSVLFSPTVAGSYVQTLALTGAGGTNLAVAGVATNAPIPVISVGASSLSLGTILTNTAATNTFTVQNSGTGTLTGTATVAAPFSILSGGSYSLTAGQSQTVSVMFSPTMAGSYAQTLALTGAGGTNMAVSGVATNMPVPVMQISASSTWLGTILTNTTATNTFTVQNSGTGTLTGSATISAPFSILSGGSYNLTAGQSQTVSVLFRPTAAGSYSQTLTLTGAGGTDLIFTGMATNALPTLPAIVVTPGSLTFGLLTSGNSQTNTITVLNAGGGTLAGTATVASPFSILSGAAFSLGANQSQAIQIVFSPMVSGNYSQTVNFSGTVATNVAVSGTGTNSVVNAPPVVSAIAANVGTVSTNSGLLMVPTLVPVTLSASVSVTNNDTMAWQWLESVGGGSATVYSAGSGTSPSVTFTNAVGTEGVRFSWTLQVTDAQTGLTAQGQLAGLVQLPAPMGLHFQGN